MALETLYLLFIQSVRCKTQKVMKLISSKRMEMITDKYIEIIIEKWKYSPRKRLHAWKWNLLSIRLLKNRREKKEKKWTTLIRIRVLFSCRRLDVPNIFNAFYIICDLARKQNFALICTLKQANKFSKYNIYKNGKYFP